MTRRKNVFVELMPLLKERTLLITVARLDEQLKVNVIPTKAKEGDDQALTTPLSYTGSPEELDAELGKHLASYVDSHLQLGSTLAEAKAEMDAAAKAARQKVKAAQQTSKPDQTAPKQETATATATVTETTPSLFVPQQPGAEPAQAANAEEGRNTTP
jgi:PRTRC genetic system protein E